MYHKSSRFHKYRWFLASPWASCDLEVHSYITDLIAEPSDAYAFMEFVVLWRRKDGIDPNSYSGTNH
jgi:hypothetical protein